MADKIIAYKVADTGTVVLPSDMSSVNTVICIGAGAGGNAGTTNVGGGPGAGGSSGGIHIATNVTLTASQSIQIAVGSKGIGGSGATDATTSRGTAGGDTWLNGTALANGVVGAQGGQIGANHFTGGAGGSSFGTAGGTKTNGTAGATVGQFGVNGSAGAGAPGTSGAGGAGGLGTTSSNPGGGGGGAPNGGAAGSTTTTTTGGAGGVYSGGSGGAGGTTGNAGSAGVSGTGGGGGGGAAGAGANGGSGSYPVLWTATDGTYSGQTFGPGSGGGGGGAVKGLGGAAGGYGAGGGGSNKGSDATTTKAGGDGSDGLIIIIYTPATGGGTTTARRSGGMGLGLRGLSLSGGFVGGVTASVSTTSPDPTVTAATIPTAPTKLALADTATATVTTAFDFNTALANATGGETIVLAAGTYNLDGIDALKKAYTSLVTVRSADINNPAILTKTNGRQTLECALSSGVKNMLFYGVRVESTTGATLAILTECLDIRFSKCIFDTSTVTNADGTYKSPGVKVKGCTRVQFDRCTFNGLFDGLWFQASALVRNTNCYRGFNTYTNISEDAARYSGNSGVLIEWEYYGTFFAAVGEHCDTSQGAVSTATNVDGSGAALNGTRNDGTGTLDQRNWDMRWSHNFMDLGRNCSFVGGANLWVQGVFLVDAYTSTETYKRLQVWDNRIWFPGNIGIQIDNATDVDIQNNLIRRSSTPAYTSSNIHARILLTGCDRVALVGNTYESLSTSGITGLTNTNTSCTNVKNDPSNVIDTADYADSVVATDLTAWQALRLAAGY